MSFRLFAAAHQRAVSTAVAPLSRSSHVAAVRSACSLLSHCGIAVAGARSSNSMIAAAASRPVGAAVGGALCESRRLQSSLQKLLDDPSDPYLVAMHDFDIPRIADIVAAGPATTGVPAAFLRRIGVHVETDGLAAARAQHAAPTPLTRRRARSSGEAVLQSLHAAGVERQAEAAAAAAAELQTAQAQYDALPAEEKAALHRERLVAHLFDGLCAMCAAMRMQVEHDGTAAPEQRDAAFSVFERLVAARGDGTIAAARWQDDFVPELKELAVVWRHLNDPRTMSIAE